MGKMAGAVLCWAWILAGRLAWIMQILSVSLKNFKIHGDRYWEFQPGINAICGENGAGKTSILEAIAWVLFDHTGDYKTADLQRQGTSTTQVTVEFISTLDNRTYRVQRQMGKSKTHYTIFDPQLNQKVDGIHRVEDALVWLKTHLGIGIQMDLTKLFGDVIGIPQGTFTADFLKKGDARRKVFDPILRVEDYKQAYQKALGLENYAQMEVMKLEQSLVAYGERLQDWPQLQALHREAQVDLAQAQERYQGLEAEVMVRRSSWEMLKAQQEELQGLERSLQEAQWQRDQQLQLQQRLKADYDQGEAAVRLCDRYRSSYEGYEALKRDQLRLQEASQHRDRLRQERSSIAQDLGQIQRQRQHLQGQLEEMAAWEAQENQLSPRIQEQETLEAQLQDLKGRWEAWRLLGLRWEQGQQQHRAQETRWQTLTQEIQTLESLERSSPFPVQELPQQQAHLQRLRDRLSHAQAAQEFHGELQTLWEQGQTAKAAYDEALANGRQTLLSLREALPLFSDPLAQLGETLELGAALQQAQLAGIGAILADLAPLEGQSLAETIALLTDHCQQVQHLQIQQARLADLRTEVAHLERTLDASQRELETLSVQIEAGRDLGDRYQDTQAALTQLGDPRAQVRWLRQRLQQKPTLLAQLTTLGEQETQWLDRDGDLSRQLAPYDALDTQLQELWQALQTQEEGHRLYLQQEALAQQVMARRQAWEAGEQVLAQRQRVYDRCVQDVQQHQAHRDPQALIQAEKAYNEVRHQWDFLGGSLPGKAQALDRLTAELTQRQRWQEEQQRLEQQREIKQRIVQFVQDARQVYKQSGPRITGYYLAEIRMEADRLFRELMNRPGVALNWTEDYEIQVQEEGDWRSFQTLSGGEQMVAALAVRLALLKVLGTIDVAFFDEPTTNMDRPRREQLAEALAQVKSFQQIFVISHDDTFENLTENVIRVDRPE